MLEMSVVNCLHTVISGGQIGADQAGLEAALIVGLNTGGTAPFLYRTQTGSNFDLRDKYGLTEDTSYDYKPRTIKNVANSDGTIVIAKNINSPGCRLTINTAKSKRKPLLVIPVPDRRLTYAELEDAKNRVISFLQANTIEIVNIAGNREHRGYQYPLFQLCLDILVPAFNECKVKEPYEQRR